MPSIKSITITDPNVRFGTTFLNTDYALRAVKDEVLMDKTTGELVYKRYNDGKFLYYNRERIDVDEFYLQLQIILNDALFWIPDAADTSYLITYLMMSQYNLNEFDFDPNYPSNFEDGGKKKNVNNDMFTISNESTGFIANIASRPRDEAMINFVTSKYDNYYKNYTGNDPEILRHTSRFNNPCYEGSNIEIQYKLTWVKDGNSVFSNTYTGYAKANQLSFIEFPNYTPPSYDDVDSVNLQIINVSIPKLKFGKEIITDQAENIMLNKLIDSQEIRLTSCNIITTITENNELFMMPDQNCCTVLLLDSIRNVSNYLEMIKSIGGGGGILLSTEYPSDNKWRNMKLWLERFRDVDPGGELVDVGSDTSFDDLEAYFGKPLPIPSSLTLDEYNRDGFYIGIKKTRSMTLQW